MSRRKKMEDPSEVDGIEDDHIQNEKKLKSDEDVDIEENLELRSWCGSDLDSDGEGPHGLEGFTPDVHNFIREGAPEPEYDPDMVLLSWYDSDLNLIIDESTFTAACPVHWDGFCYLQGGVRATHGFRTGQVYYEVKITSLCKIKMLKGHLNTHLIRIGWSPAFSSLALGSDRLSFGFDSNGRASTEGEIKDYGKLLKVEDVIGVYLDLKGDSADLFFTVNGEDQGIAYKIPKSELKNEAMYPHILTKNIAFECNFGSERTWFAPKKGFTYVDDMPLNERVPGPRPPKNKADCEVIMLVGLPKSGKSTWAREMAGRYPGKYYIIDVVNFVDKMELMDPARRKLFLKKIKVARKLLQIASHRCRNYILDQVNASRSEQLSKLKSFANYQRRAVVFVPPEEEYEKRLMDDPREVKDWIMYCKCKMTLPQPSGILSSIEYVGLPKKQAQRLIKNYNREAWVKGFKPYKHFVVRPYVYHKLHKDKKTWKQFPAKRGRFADPAGDPKITGRMSPPNIASQDWHPDMGEGPSDGRNPQRPGFEDGPPRSRKEFFMQNRCPDWKQQEMLRDRQFNVPRDCPEQDFRDQEWSPPPKKVSRWPPGSRSAVKATSLSPPRSKLCSPPRNTRRVFHQESTLDTDRGRGMWCLQEDRSRGWGPRNRRRNQEVSPERVRGGFLGPERGDCPGFPHSKEEETFEGATPPHMDRVEQVSPARNRPASFSPPRRNFHMHQVRSISPQERFPEDQPPQNSRPNMGFPPFREPLRGEERLDRGFPQRGRTDGDLPPQDGRVFRPGEKRIRGNFPPQGRPGGGITPEKDRSLDGFFLRGGRNRGFRNFEESIHSDDFPVKKEKLPREGRFCAFPGQEEGRIEGFTPQKSQERSNVIQERDIRMPEKAVAGNDFPYRGHGNCDVSLEDKRDYFPHSRRRASGSLSPSYRPQKHFILESRAVAEGCMGGKASNLYACEDKYLDGLPHFSKLQVRSGNGPMSHLSKPVGNLLYCKDNFTGDNVPHERDLTGPSSYREEKADCVWPSTEVDPYAGNQLLKTINPEWNSKFSSKDRTKFHSSLTHPGKIEVPENRDHGPKGQFPGGETKMLQGSVDKDGRKPGGNKDRIFPNDCLGSWKREPGSFSEESFHNKRDDHDDQHKSSFWHPQHGFSSSTENIHNDKIPGSLNQTLGGKFGGEINQAIPPGGYRGVVPVPANFVGSHSAIGANDALNHGSRRSDYSSRSPVQEARRSPNCSPRRTSDRTTFWSPDRGPVGFPDCEISSGSGTRGSSDHVSRRLSGRKSRWSSIRDRSPRCPTRWSPNTGLEGSPHMEHRRSRDPGGSPELGSRGSPGRGPRGSPERRFRGSPGQGSRRSPGQRFRGSPGRGPRGPQGQGFKGPPGRGFKRSEQGFREPPGRGPRGSPDSEARYPERGPRGSPDRSPRGSLERGPRGSLERRPRGSLERRPRGSLERHPRGSLERGTRGSLKRSPRRSPNRGFRGSLGSRTKRSPVWGIRSSPGRDSRGSPGLSPGRGLRGHPNWEAKCPSGLKHSGSPDWDSRGPADQFRRELPDRVPQEPTYQGPRGPPEVSSLRGSRQISPESGRLHSSMEGKNEREWPRKKTENRSWPQTEVVYGGNLEGLPPNVHLPHQDFRKSVTPDGAENARNWPSGEFRNRRDIESKQHRFMEYDSGGSAAPPAGVDINRSRFLRGRLGPKVSDSEPINSFEDRPGMDDADSNDWHLSAKRNELSCRGSNNNAGYWERRVLIVPENLLENRDMEELAPYEQPFNQAVWDNNDPHSSSMKGDPFFKIHPQEGQGGNGSQPSDYENRRNVWARVGGYVDDDKGPARDRLGSPILRVSHRSPNNTLVTGRSRSREHGRKPPRRPTGRRSPGRKSSSPSRSRLETRRFNPYEDRKPPQRSGFRGRFRSPRRKW